MYISIWIVFFCLFIFTFIPFSSLSSFLTIIPLMTFIIHWRGLFLLHPILWQTFLHNLTIFFHNRSLTPSPFLQSQSLLRSDAPHTYLPSHLLHSLIPSIPSHSLKHSSSCHSYYYFVNFSLFPSTTFYLTIFPPLSLCRQTVTPPDSHPSQILLRQVLRELHHPVPVPLRAVQGGGTRGAASPLWYLPLPYSRQTAPVSRLLLCQGENAHTHQRHAYTRSYPQLTPSSPLVSPPTETSCPWASRGHGRRRCYDWRAAKPTSWTRSPSWNTSRHSCRGSSHKTEENSSAGVSHWRHT